VDAKSIGAAKTGDKNAKARDPFELLLKTIHIDMGIKTHASTRRQPAERNPYNEIKIATEAHSPKYPLKVKYP